MNTGKRSNVLLVELLIVILFFMIGSVILMQVFEKTYNQSQKAKAETTALAEGQSMADRLYQAGIRAVWNFTPVDLHCPEDMTVMNVRMSDSLHILSYMMNHREA